jgi:LuxR family transcriptional regulator, quorum-sensing system regulator BjaR1
MNESIADINAQIWEMQTVSEILRRCALEFFALGAVRFSYLLPPAYHAQTGERTLIKARGFAPEWTSLYIDPKFRKDDPITDYIMAKGRPMTWREAVDEQKISTGQRSFLHEFQRFHPIDGVGIPLYGPYCMDGFCAFSTDKPIEPNDVDMISPFRRLALGAHTRISVIKGEAGKKKCGLSRRETDVLRLMAMAQSNKEIALAMRVSPASVDTYARRIFAKLGTSDRVEASLLGISYGLIKF